MPTQPQIQQQKRNRLPSTRIIIAIVLVFLVASGITIGTLNVLSIIQIPFPGFMSIIFLSIIIPIVIPLLSPLVTFFQWLFPFSPKGHDEKEVAPKNSSVPVSPMPPIIINVPPTTNVELTSPPVNKTIYHGIVGFPPPTHSKTIQQREKTVKEVYMKLIQEDVTAIVLTGIGGVGKSTLAALVSKYEEEELRTGNSSFKAEPLWLSIDSSVTIDDLIGTLCEALGQSLPETDKFSVQNQLALLFKVLNTTEKPRLVIIDQFESLLDWKTGYALTDKRGVGELLDILNSQKCICRVLLTSRQMPKGTREYLSTYMQEYHVKGLEEEEGIELLRNMNIEGTDAEIHSTVKLCAGHALSLTLLVSLLRQRNLSLTSLFKDSTYSQLWKGNIAKNLLDSIYTHLDQIQRKLLVAFSVFQEPVPLTAVQAVLDKTPKMTKVQIESALDALLAQYLLQAPGEGHYQLHAIVASYAESHFVDDNKQANQLALREARMKAAQYYHRAGQIYYAKGLKEKTRECYQKELSIRRQIKPSKDVKADRSRVGLTLYNIGLIYYEQRHYEAALASMLLAKQIFEETNSPDHEKIQKWLDKLQRTIGKDRFIELVHVVVPKANVIVERVLNENEVG